MSLVFVSWEEKDYYYHVISVAQFSVLTAAGTAGSATVCLVLAVMNSMACPKIGSLFPDPVSVLPASQQHHYLHINARLF